VLIQVEVNKANSNKVNDVARHTTAIEAPMFRKVTKQKKINPQFLIPKVFNAFPKMILKSSASNFFTNIPLMNPNAAIVFLSNKRRCPKRNPQIFAQSCSS